MWRCIYRLLAPVVVAVYAYSLTHQRTAVIFFGKTDRRGGRRFGMHLCARCVHVYLCVCVGVCARTRGDGAHRENS